MEKVDTGEMVYISSLSLLKMLKHGEIASPHNCHFHQDAISPFNVEADKH